MLAIGSLLRLKNVMFLLLLFLVVPSLILAQKTTIFYIAGDWSDEFNWDNGLPEDGDDVVINADCTVDMFAYVPMMGNLDINALLDNTDWDYNFDVDYLNINSGGDFRCDGNLRVYFDFSMGDFDNDGTTASGTFNGTVTVDGDMDISDSYDECYATFNNKVTVTGLYNSGIYATVVFNDSVSTANFTAGGAVTIKKKLTCAQLSIPGAFNVYADIDCRAFLMKSGGQFNLFGDYTVTVTSGSADPDVDVILGVFQPSQGTFVLKKGDASGPSITSTLSNYFHHLTIEGDTYFGDEPYVEDLDVNGNLVIASGATLTTYNNNLKIAGDFTCNGTYFLGSYTPTVTFDGNGTQTLTGNVDFYHLTVASNSTLLTGSYTPTVSPYSLTENGYLQGNIQCTQGISSDATFTVGNLGCEITNGAGLGSVTITRHTGSSYTLAPHSLTRWYNITATTADNSVTLRLYYRDSELNNNTESDLNIWRYAGGSWQKFVPTTRDAANNYVEATVDIPAGSSDWILSDAQEDQSLPVSLLRFWAETQFNNQILLKWTVASEIDNAGFLILRREKPDSVYVEIGYVQGRGNANASKTYEFLDAYVRINSLYDYQLFSVTINGGKELIATLENVKPIVHEANQPETTLPEQFELYPVFPNPFNPSTTIRYAVPVAGAVRISVHDLQGRHVCTLVDRHIEPGNYQVSWDGRNQWGISVPSGVYFVRMNADRFQAVRKVMFLK